MVSHKKFNVEDIFPFYLPRAFAENLVNQYASQELKENTSFWHPQSTEYSYSAKVLPSGEVELSVSFSRDTGFIMSSGNCLSKTITPFSKETFERLLEDRKFEIATNEYCRRRQEAELLEIKKVLNELFGEKSV